MPTVCKTKIVCTIGPASDSPALIRRMLHAGMNIARLNYSHGDFPQHKKAIENLRLIAREVQKSLTIMADLPGPRLRIGGLVKDVITLVQGNTLTLTTNEVIGNEARISVNFPRLPEIVKAGDAIFLNDGGISLEVQKVAGHTVMCRLLTGGDLRPGKGLNLPGIDLGIRSFTEHDHDCLKSALENGVDAIGQSFVETQADVDEVRKAATILGYHPFIIARIERAGALARIDEILRAADGIMIARGDLGIEIPVEKMAVIQKQLICKANILGKPVIVATQMLESMVNHTRPTRAESTDVANAVLDGADCVTLSEETAMGKFPVEAVGMLAKIAATTEPHRLEGRLHEVFADFDRHHEVPLTDLISHNVQQTVQLLGTAAVIVSSNSGHTARMISRFKLPVWIVAVSRDKAACQGLQFSYGVHSVHEPDRPEDWNEFARRWVLSQGLTEGLVVLTEGPSPDNPTANHRLEVIDLTRPKKRVEAQGQA